jgi:3-deoxy-manno-octulosonate cytidylyltransferase (CMP-KDO synthetase)
MTKTSILIPSRLNAKRLPSKPLLKINGISIIQHVYHRAKESKVGEVIVATGDKEIAEEIKSIKGEVILTKKNHLTGTDRIYEALEILDNKNKPDYVINLQGDEPFISPDDIFNLNKYVIENKSKIGTLAHNIKDKTEKDLKKIKFSKALKFFRDCSKLNTINLFQHIGIYQYKMSTLIKYVNLKQSKNELKYSLEQYRAIDNNIFIDVVLAKKMSIGIDTMDEYVEIKKIMEYKS